MTPKSKSKSKEKKSKRSKSKSKEKKSKKSKDKKKKKKKKEKKQTETDSSDWSQETENEEEENCDPVQKINSSDLLPEEAKEVVDISLDERIRDRVLSKRQFSNHSDAQLKFKEAILEAAADITSQFHEKYITRLAACNVYETLVGCNYPQSTFDTIKQGFLSYLNSTGRYIQIRELLRSSVTKLIQNNFGALEYEGFKEAQDFQNFVHNLYTSLTDTLQETLTEAEFCEGSAVPNASAPLCRRNVPSVVQRLTLRDLHFFAQEAMVLGDFENAQRLHLQRICQDIHNPAYWLDFAIMWAERGEDKMAEIALREVLKLDPDNVIGLLMMGITAARNRNPRAIPLIGHALRIRPLAPEIHVILATAYRLLGKEKESKYFFLKARCVHLRLSGGDSSKVEAALRSFDFSIPTSLQNKPEKKKKKKKTRRGKGTSGSESESGSSKSTKSSGSDSTGSKKKKSKKKKKNKSKSTKGSATSDTEEEKETTKSKSKSRKKRKKQKAGSHNSGDFNDKDGLFTSGDNLSMDKRPVPLHVSYYDFPIDIIDTIRSQAPLGSLNPNLRITWDWDIELPSIPCTTRQDSSSPTPSPDGSSIKSVNRKYDSGISDTRSIEFGNENIIMEEFNNFVINDVKPVKHSEGKRSGPDFLKSPRSGRKKKSRSPKGSGKSHKSRKSDKSSSSEKSGKSKKSNRSTKSKDSSKSKKRRKSKDPEADTSAKEQSSTGRYIQMSESDEIKKWDFRYGSEYIWTAQLLLQLHAYDFLDLILAKELYASNNQSVLFLYILAVSRYLRGQQDVALRLVTEILRNPEFSKNSHLLELKAHILMVKGDLAEAKTYFENAIKMVQFGHNLHLAYLQLGYLFTATGEDEQAKSTFLNCVSLFPSMYSWLALGSLYYKLEEYSSAEIAYAHANRLDSTNPEIWGMLSLISLAQGNRMLSEQTYKWAVRFGLSPDGKLMEDIKNMQTAKGYGDPTSPIVPDCIPHDYYLRRLGKQFPIQFYREALHTSTYPSSTHPSQDQELRQKLMQRIQRSQNFELEGEHE